MAGPDLLAASRTDKLWHEMRAGFEAVGGTLDADRLACPVCGRVLDRARFSLEHIVPRQALDDDPGFVKAAVAASTRSGHVLLCRAPLAVKGQRRPQGNGCNGWKGSHYDRPLRELMNGSSPAAPRTPSERVVAAALAVGYLAMVAKYGYQVAFTPAGILLRRQFLFPDRLLRALPPMSQVLLAGQAPVATPDTLSFWKTPFRFTVEGEACFVSIRKFGIRLPVSRDPRLPVPRGIRFVPHHYLLRPDFGSVLD